MTSDEGKSPQEGGAPRTSIHQPPPGAHLMNIIRWMLFVGLSILALVSIASYIAYRMELKAPSGKVGKAARVIYRCPMHPAYTSDKPGDCPICGMSLEKVTDTDEHAAHAGMGHEGDVPGLTPVHMTPERVQLIGVRFARVERRTFGGTLDLVGFVTPDEGRIRRVQIRVSGWVQQLFVNRTGEKVRVGEPLLSIYSPELYQSEREYLIAHEAGGMGEHGAGGATGGGEPGGATAEATGERLRLLGVPGEELLRLERERTPVMNLTLRSPVSGTVLERGVLQGQYVGADTPLLTVADLSRVWVLADLYEMDFERVHTGDRAVFTADGMPGRTFEGRVELVNPTVSSETRTLKLRIGLDDPTGVLRPGMYGHVAVRGAAETALVVPGEAVVNAGEHSYVFLARGGGHFEPRMVWVGLRDADQVQIVRGLAAGDTVVSSASFLIDSESRLKAAMEGMGGKPAPAHNHGGM
ncbi:MAG: efflux RND transporter periplasmic adaptor subunit [Candidatus Eisenbacteria bacterium]|nr:efflux RND transporter periplasmic adaptor subunit [Candidatus Eisenbacteria bacterium]